MEKMLEDLPNLDENMTSQYAASIKNCCLYIKRFTPAQFAIGQNPQLPSTFNDKLPALEGCSTSPIILEHLKAIVNARKAFVQAETSAKLFKALKHQSLSNCDSMSTKGDNILYRSPQEKRWHGPAIVIGTDGKLIAVKHGTIMQQVHLCNRQHTNNSKNNKDILPIEKPSNISQPTQIERNNKQLHDNVGLLSNNLCYKLDYVISLPVELKRHLNTPVPLPQTQNDILGKTI